MDCNGNNQCANVGVEIDSTSWFRRSVLFWHQNSSISSSSLTTTSSGEDDYNTLNSNNNFILSNLELVNTPSKKKYGLYRSKSDVVKRNRSSSFQKSTTAKVHQQQHTTLKNNDLHYVVEFPKNSIVRWSPLHQNKYNYHYMKATWKRQLRTNDFLDSVNSKMDCESKNITMRMKPTEDFQSAEKELIGSDVLEGIHRVEQTLMDIAMEIRLCKSKNAFKTRTDANEALRQLFEQIKPPPIELCRSKCIEINNNENDFEITPPLVNTETASYNQLSIYENINRHELCINEVNPNFDQPEITVSTIGEREAIGFGNNLSPHHAVLACQLSAGHHSDSGFSDCPIARDQQLFIPSKKRESKLVNEHKRNSFVPSREIDTETDEEFMNNQRICQDNSKQRRRRNQTGSSRRSIKTRSTGSLASKCQQSLLATDEKSASSCPNFASICKESIQEMYSPVEIEAVRKFLSFASQHFESGNEVGINSKPKEHVYNIIVEQQQQLSKQAEQQEKLETQLKVVVEHLKKLQIIPLCDSTTSSNSSLATIALSTGSNLRITETPQNIGGHIWKIPDISQKISQAKMNRKLELSCVYSDEFYLTSNCYKFRCICYPSSKSHPNFTSIYVQAIQGEFDEDLKWPLRPICEYTVLDQTRNNANDYKKVKHVEDTIRDRENDLIASHNGIPRPKDGEKIQGFFGIEKFIPHDVLYDQKYQYIVNDTIFIKIDFLLA